MWWAQIYERGIKLFSIKGVELAERNYDSIWAIVPITPAALKQ